MVLYWTPDHPQSCPDPDQLQVPLSWVKGRFYVGFHFPFVKLLVIGYWFHAYLIGEYWGGSKCYPHMWESNELRIVI